MEDYDARPERPCIGCGQVDRAPRDAVALPDGNTALYHMDCHVMVANCQVCKQVLETAKNKKNEELFRHLTGDRSEKIFTTENAANDGVVLLKDGGK
jgi:hypothetical protein